MAGSGDAMSLDASREDTAEPTLERLVRVLDAELAASALPVVENAAAQLIRFAVGEANFAMAAEQMAEVDSVPAVTFVPRTPAAIRGLANLRGEVVVVVDLGLFFGLGDRLDNEDRSTERMIVLRDAGRGLPGGVIVDRVFGITSYAPDKMSPPSRHVPAFALPFVSGCIVVEGDEVAIIDLPAIAAAAVSWQENIA